MISPGAALFKLCHQIVDVHSELAEIQIIYANVLILETQSQFPEYLDLTI